MRVIICGVTDPLTHSCVRQLSGDPRQIYCKGLTKRD